MTRGLRLYGDDGLGGIGGTGISFLGDAVVTDLTGTWQIDCRGDHVLVAITAATAAPFLLDPPLRYEFATDATFTTPITSLIEATNARFIGTADTASASSVNHYAYLYLLPNDLDHRIFMRPHDNTINGAHAISVVGIAGLVEVGGGGTVLGHDPDTTQTFGPETDADGGLWLTVGFPANDHPHNVNIPNADAGLEAPPTIDLTSISPQVALAGYGTTSTAVTWTSGVAFPMVGWTIELLGYHPPDTVAPPIPELVFTEVFTSTITGVGGQRRGTPMVTATEVFDASLSPPASGGEWRAVLVDQAGTVHARMPDAVIGSIVETLNDTTTTTVTVPLSSLAGTIIDAASSVPELEVQVWRGNVLWLWGPVTEPAVDGDSYRLAVRDPSWHFGQRHIGEPGGEFGGRPPYFHDRPENLRFGRGDLTGWSIFRTISIGEFPGFGTPDLDAIVLDPDRHLPSGEPMAKCTSPLDPLDNYQLFQDLNMVGPQNGRPLRVTLSGWWFIPSDGGFGPNNQRMGLLLATLLEDAVLPRDYYLPTDWSFTTLDDTCPRDRLFYQECTLELPPGVETLVHASVCFPQGVSFVGGLDLTVDDGLLYDESPTTIGAGLVNHAQDPAFGRDDLNIDSWWNTLGDREVREYVFNDHTVIGDAITQLARDGWFDWWASYVAGGRVMNFYTRKRGSYRPELRMRLDANGRGNVVSVARKRTVGATVVAAQMRSRTEGNHEAQARTDGLVLEELFVAQREPSDYDLAGLAAERLDLTSRPEVIEVDLLSHDEARLLGLQVGDTTDVLSSAPGALATGRYRVTQRTIDTQRDAATLVLHPAEAT